MKNLKDNTGNSNKNKKKVMESEKRGSMSTLGKDYDDDASSHDSLVGAWIASGIRLMTIGSGFVTGWGHQNDKAGNKIRAAALFEAETEIFADEVCMWMWRSAYDRRYEICAGTAACQGDSGGPLAVRRNGSVIQIGVVSYGPKTCNIGPFLGPTVYERITAHMDFIEENTRDAVWCSN